MNIVVTLRRLKKKVDELSKSHGGGYTPPTGGIPRTDFDQSVQTSLNKADSAVQTVKVNGTTVTPDANKVVNVQVPTDYQVDYSKQYLTFTALEDGTFQFSQNALQYSLDDGKTWETLAANTATPTITTGSKIIWKQTGLTPSIPYGIGTFSSTCKFNVSGNIMSLLYGDDFVGQQILPNYSFSSLFMRCNIMFAKDLMLPAITLTEYCYASMFFGCTSLTTAPQLSATTLEQGCYDYMFSGCASLIKSPELPATTLAESCYRYMFNGCTSLSYIECLATNISAANCTTNWVQNVAPSGTFVKADSMTSWITGNDGIPSGWSAHTEEEYEVARKYEVSGKEDTSNKVTSISSTSTDTQYPSAKCVYDAIAASGGGGNSSGPLVLSVGSYGDQHDPAIIQRWLEMWDDIEADQYVVVNPLKYFIFVKHSQSANYYCESQILDVVVDDVNKCIRYLTNWYIYYNESTGCLEEVYDD